MYSTGASKPFGKKLPAAWHVRTNTHIAYEGEKKENQNKCNPILVPCGIIFQDGVAFVRMSATMLSVGQYSNLRHLLAIVSWMKWYLVLLWLEPPLANDFCNFLNKIAKIMKIFVKVDLLKGYQPSANTKWSDQLFLSYLIGYVVAQKNSFWATT